MTDEEMDEWSSEGKLNKYTLLKLKHRLTVMAGDRVQWFRAEAEMQRWQEQGEQKLAELLRTNRSFTKMERTWTSLASTNVLPGHQAYARQKAAMYRIRAKQAQDLVVAVGYGDLLAKNASIIGRVQSDRDREARFISDAVLRVDE